MKQNLPGGLSAVVPPDPMPNSEVKRRSADGSVGSPHARVGNCQVHTPRAGYLTPDHCLVTRSIALRSVGGVGWYERKDTHGYPKSKYPWVIFFDVS